jgi:AAA domain/DnaB-like helicase N terminal domain
VADGRTRVTNFDSIGQRLPHNAEAERNLLGAVLIDNAHLRAAESVVVANDFFMDPYRTIFRAMQALDSEGKSIDIATLHDVLKDDPALRHAGGAAFIAALGDGVPRIAPVGQWACIVRDASVLRIAAHVGQTITNDALEPKAKAAEVVDRTHRRVASLHTLLTGHIAGVLASEVEIERVEWAWNARIPLGKVTVFDGDPGLGKSALSLDIAARISTGTPMPDGVPGVEGGVLIMNAEDGEADTIVPRLLAMGANLNRVRILKTISDSAGERQPEIPADLGIIERAALSVDARLIVIDPLMAFLSGATNSFRDQDIRRALAPLATMAERLRAAILIVRHLNKAPDGNPLYRGGGSIGIIGAARSGLLVAPDPDDETGERRVLAVTKTNLGPCPTSLSYFITPEAESIRVQWCGESNHRAATLLAAPDDNESRGAAEEAVEFLKSFLADGPVAATEVWRKAKSAHISKRTIDRAKKLAGVRARREGFGKGSTWMWEL